MDALDEEDQEDLAEAMFRLAEFYRRGWTVDVDQEKATSLYKQAMEKGKWHESKKLDHGLLHIFYQ
jgi:TPR repeat protein